MKDYSYEIAGSADDLFPTETHFGLFRLEDGTMADIPQQYPFGGPWGEPAVEGVSVREKKPLPTHFEIAYLSVVEEKFYYLSIPVNPSDMRQIIEQLEPNDSAVTHNLIVGMAPYGQVAIWFGDRQKQLLLGWLQGSEVKIDMKDFLPQKPEMTLSEYCLDYINNAPLVSTHIATNGLPLQDYFMGRMRQFTYRYLPLFDCWDNGSKVWKSPEGYGKEATPELDYVEESLFDGTHDKLHNGGLLKYHRAGKPKKLALKWHVNKSEYMAYFWFEEEPIRVAFDRFYGPHPDTKTDFIIRIDHQKNKYQLSLYRYGLPEPRIISESAYQLIVFKNKFEYFRSENYDQPCGAWVW